ncbi:MAG: hypothetical protein OHK0045_16830 [Raineya sp.]
MKKILLTISIFLVFQVLVAQNRCNRPLSSFEFNQKKQQIVSVGNEARRLQMAITASQENCFTALQVKEIAQSFSNEFNRLEYAQKAHATVFDPENYYEVYDAFKRFSMAIRLYDFVNGKGGSNPVLVTPKPNNPNPTTPSPSVSYPNYNYPDFENYIGKKNCGFPISESVFEAMVERIRATNPFSLRLNVARQSVQNNCLSTSQVMRLVSILPEANRLEILRLSYEHIYDVNNLFAASQVFDIKSNQEQWVSFLNQNGVGATNPSNPIGGICEVPANEYNSIVNTLRRESIQSNRFNLMKNIVGSYECFSVEQVRGIVKLYNMDSFRLDAAKYLFEHTNPNERRQYFVVANDFSFASSRQDLSNFLAEKNR